MPEVVPFIPDRQRLAIRTAYMSAPDHKAIAISFVQAAFITDQKDEDIRGDEIAVHEQGWIEERPGIGKSMNQENVKCHAGNDRLQGDFRR